MSENELATQKRDIQNLIKQHERRLNKLKENKARTGYSAPPEIEMEIEDIEGEVKNLKKELQAIKNSEKLSEVNRLEVFHTTNQVMDLRASEYGLALYMFDNRPKRKKGLRWKIPAEKLENIEIRVYPSRKYTQYGLFAIGPKYDWLYSKAIFPTEKELEDAIRSIIKKSIELSKKKAKK